MKAPNWVRTYENGPDYIESAGGIDWCDAPLPRRFHRCRTQTRGWLRFSYVERCACGATRLRPGKFWIGRNERRS